MNYEINNNSELINTLNSILATKKDCVVNIVNDKLTLSVFGLLEKNLKNVKEINFVIRDTRYIPSQAEISREFEMQSNTNDMLFNTYDITEKNKLLHFRKAKSMYDFIKKHVNVRKTLPKVQIRSNVIIIDEDFMIQGSSSLEISNKSQKNEINNINFNTILNGSMDKNQIVQANKTFNRIRYDEKITSDFKEELLKSLSYVYKEHSPEFLYYFTLNQLFGKQLDYGVERFEKDHVDFKKTNIWNALFDFQKDAVQSAIQKIEKYNGCIIADSVGLGKTFEALAIIKYYELRQDNVLVLTPAKLYDNWLSFKGDYKDSVLDEVFNYKIMFHTDLSRTKGMSKSGRDLKRFDWSKFDLIVIDESHAFRNRNIKEEGMSRYQKLMEAIIQGNTHTKLLMLSATPVNNSLVDLKNQISLITADRDDAFEEQGISSVENLLRQTTRVINQWDSLESEEKNKERLLNDLPANFYKLLEMITIARSRKHITSYYGTDQIGTFPSKMKPDTFKVKTDTLGEVLNFKDTNEILEKLTLAVYAPLSYIKSKYVHIYREKYETVNKSGKVLMSNERRDNGLKTLHRFNLFKRLESSVFSFSETIRRLNDKIDNFISAIENSMKDIEVEIESEEDEEILLDYKFEINVEHLNKENFLDDLYYDKKVLEELSKNINIILDDNRDCKLKVLKNTVKQKVKSTPYNDGNRKIIIFTAFSDTAKYIYNQIEKELFDEGVYCACITGSDKPLTNNINVDKEFNSILCAFSPKSKTKGTIGKEKEIDILVATDCISEGQNLQDCDCVINYDVQWNPVSLIQRFGRIDRIGSHNKRIKMINFFPDVELEEYLRLEQRVKGKMVVTNIVSTGDEDFLSPEMNDFNFRKRQLERLRDEVIDIDDAAENISLTDLNMNDYLYELSEYLKIHDEIKNVPAGIYSVTDGMKKGAIFCFRHRNVIEKPKNDTSLYPYYLIYISEDKEILYSNRQTRETLKLFRKLCYKKENADDNLFKKFLKETKQTKDMSLYSSLLSKSIEDIQGTEEKEAEQTIFDFGGFNNEFESENIDDFELISFLVVK